MLRVSSRHERGRDFGSLGLVRLQQEAGIQAQRSEGNSLSVASVEKLVFIKSNMGAFYDMPVAGYDESDVDAAIMTRANKTKISLS